jgi:magnesium-transporting ATPase (P-type)
MEGPTRNRQVIVKPLGWSVVLGAAAFGAVAVVAGLRVWQGGPINTRNTLETENKLAVLTVTLLPVSVMFFCWAFIGLVSEVGSRTKGVIAGLVIIVEVVLGVISLAVFLIAVTLFFFSRPARFVPPHLRTRS